MKGRLTFTGLFLLLFLFTGFSAATAGGLVLKVETPGLTSPIAVDSSSGDIVVGGISNGTGLGDFDVFLMKLAEDGKILWKKAYGGAERDILYSVKLLPNGNAVATGGSTSLGGGWVFEVGKNGNVLWSKTYNTSMVYSAIPYSDGFLAVSSISGVPLLMRLDSKGNVESARILTPGESALPVKIVVLPGEPIFVAGVKESGETKSPDFWLARISGDGKVIWQKTYGGNGTEKLYDAELDARGVTLVGYTSSFSTSGVDLLVVRTDLLGNVEWAKVIGGPGDDWANGVSLLPTGDLVLGGISYSSGDTQAWILVMDTSGRVKKWITFGTPRMDWIRAVTVTPDGKLVVAGGIDGKASGPGNLVENRPMVAIFDGSSFEGIENCTMVVGRPPISVKDAEITVTIGKPVSSPPDVTITAREADPKVKEMGGKAVVVCSPGATTESTTPSTTSPPATTSSSPPDRTTTTTHRGGWSICGPVALVALSILPLVLRRRW